MRGLIALMLKKRSSGDDVDDGREVLVDLDWIIKGSTKEGLWAKMESQSNIFIHLMMMATIKCVLFLRPFTTVLFLLSSWYPRKYRSVGADFWMINSLPDKLHRNCLWLGHKGFVAALGRPAVKRSREMVQGSFVELFGRSVGRSPGVSPEFEYVLSTVDVDFRRKWKWQMDIYHYHHDHQKQRCGWPYYVQGQLLLWGDSWIHMKTYLLDNDINRTKWLFVCCRNLLISFP